MSQLTSTMSSILIAAFSHGKRIVPFPSINGGSFDSEYTENGAEHFDYRAISSYFAAIPFSSAHGC